MNTFRKLPVKRRAILIIQSLAMTMGASTHIGWALQYGFLAEEYNAPLSNMLFWDSLTFLDPLAALLLYFNPRHGVILTLIIIIIDVIHNNWFYFDELYLQGLDLGEWIEKYWMILGQIIFAVFVIATFKGNLKAIQKAS